MELKNRFPEAERTMAFQFEKPAEFTFKPGFNGLRLPLRGTRLLHRLRYSVFVISREDDL